MDRYSGFRRPTYLPSHCDNHNSGFLDVRSCYGCGGSGGIPPHFPDSICIHCSKILRDYKKGFTFCQDIILPCVPYVSLRLLPLRSHCYLLGSFVRMLFVCFSFRWKGSEVLGTLSSYCNPHIVTSRAATFIQTLRSFCSQQSLLVTTIKSL